jgi:hypothetical protein
MKYPIIGHGTSTYKIPTFRGILQEKYNIGCISEVILQYSEDWSTPVRSVTVFVLASTRSIFQY